ncbi:hypothetical protein Aduo_010193 [Ancylostoma duodenale]
MSTTDISGASSPPTTPLRYSRAVPSEVRGGQMFFEFDAPEAFISPQLFAVNPSGSVRELLASCCCSVEQVLRQSIVADDLLGKD